MSAAPGLEPVAARPKPRRRPPLAVVPAHRAVPTGGPLERTPFVALVVSLLAAGLLGLLVLNTALAQDAFRLHTLKQDARVLEDREQALQREVEALQAPQELAARATALGMVEAGPPAFLRLSDGAVLGAETPAAVPVPTGPDAPVDPDVPAAEQAAAGAAAEGPATEEPATGEAPTDEAPTDEAPTDEAPAGEAPDAEPAAAEAEGGQ